MKPTPPNTCNVLDLSADRRRLWCFDVAGDGKAELDEEFSGLPGDALPTARVAKDWRALFSRRSTMVSRSVVVVMALLRALPNLKEARLARGARLWNPPGVGGDMHMRRNLPFGVSMVGRAGLSLTLAAFGVVSAPGCGDGGGSHEIGRAHV